MDIMARQQAAGANGGLKVVGLLQAIQLQTHIGLSCLQLGDSSDEARYSAMLALRKSGPAGLPWLRIAVRRSGHPRMQIASAVVLHWLGDPEGMAVLVEAIQCKLSPDPTLALLLEAAFIAIGPPDATTTLLQLWGRLPDGVNAHLTMTCICRIWAALQDPLVLDTLGVYSTRIPDLFEQTVPSFGKSALPMLRRLTLDADSFRRRLAARTLRHIPLMDSFAVLTPLLRDPDLSLRSEIPAALEATGGIVATARELTEAIRAGYATPPAVQSLLRARPVDLYETLLCLVERGSSPEINMDQAESDALQQALPLLARAPLPNARLIPALCHLLERPILAPILIAAARALGTRGQTGEAYDTLARRVLWHQLIRSDSLTRSEIAAAQSCLGEPFGSHLTQLLEECRPQGNLLEKLQAVLRGGPDAGQAASMAVQQVSQWFTRLSKETVDRWNSPAPAGHSLVLRTDPRLPELLRQMLDNSLNRLDLSLPAEEMERSLTDSAAILRLLGRLGTPTARIAHHELLRALHCIKRALISVAPGVAPFPRPEQREVAGMIRASAVETLLILYGADSFPLFLEALYATQPEVNHSAIAALARLGDVRALSHLQPLAGNSVHALCPAAIDAIAVIKRTNPEMMTLLRGSSAADAQQDTLLRPAAGIHPTVSPDLLLRPSAQGGDEAAA